jgi:hypothetical protein
MVWGIDNWDISGDYGFCIILGTFRYWRQDGWSLEVRKYGVGYIRVGQWVI